MPSKFSFLSLLLWAHLLFPFITWARTAADYFHTSGNLYIEGRIQEAKIEIEEGLKYFPQDTQLKNLLTHIQKIKPPPKQDENPSSSDQNENNSDQDKKDNKNQSPQENQENQQQKQNPKNQKDEQKNNQDKQQSTPPPSEGQQDQNPADKKDSLSAGQANDKKKDLSPEEARRLLESFENDEKNELERNRRQPRGGAQPAQDW